MIKEFLCYDHDPHSALPSSEVTPITVTRMEQHSEMLRLMAAPSATIVATP